MKPWLTLFFALATTPTGAGRYTDAQNFLATQNPTASRISMLCEAKDPVCVSLLIALYVNAWWDADRFGIPNICAPANGIPIIDPKYFAWLERTFLNRARADTNSGHFVSGQDEMADTLLTIYECGRH